MHGVDVAAPRQVGGDLLDPVSRGVENRHLDLATARAPHAQILEELLGVRGARIDEDDLAALRLHREREVRRRIQVGRIIDGHGIGN